MKQPPKESQSGGHPVSSSIRQPLDVHSTMIKKKKKSKNHQKNPNWVAVHFQVKLGGHLMLIPSHKKKI